MVPASRDRRRAGRNARGRFKLRLPRKVVKPANTIQSIANASLLNFKNNVRAVDELMTFDRVVLDLCISQLEERDRRLQKSGIDNPYLGTGNTIQALKNIQKNSSLKTRYEEMHNQCLVLLISYFGLSVRDLFKGSLANVLRSGKLGELARHEVKIQLGDLTTGSDDFAERLAEIFLTQKDVSFQDMQSMRRAFSDFLSVKPERDRHVNNIILAQACRHVIVHSGANVDAKLIRQISEAIPRDLKPELSLGIKIRFEPNEIQTVAKSMVVYIEGLCTRLVEQWG